MAKAQEEQLGWVAFLKEVVRLLGPNKKAFLFWNSILIIVQFYQLVPPLIIGRIVDFFTEYTPGAPLNEFYFYVALLSISFAFVSFLRLTLKKRIGRLTNTAVYDIRLQGFTRLHWGQLEITKHLIRLSKKRKKNHGSGSEWYIWFSKLLQMKPVKGNGILHCRYETNSRYVMPSRGIFDYFMRDITLFQKGL